eukprot:3492958-Pyramimonas_sp.AAC.1
MVVGVDANAALGQRAAADDRRIIGPHGTGARNERGHQLSIGCTAFAWSQQLLFFRRLGVICERIDCAALLFYAGLI